MIADSGASEPVEAAKSRLRRRVLAARRGLTPDVLSAARAAVAGHVLMRISSDVRTVAAYEPFGTEPGSTELLAALHAGGRRVLVPVVDTDNDLQWKVWTVAAADDVGPIGRDAIGDADLVLVPALAVGPHGERLGRGGGSYDRALRRTRAPVVALLHRGERDLPVPVAGHDVPVHAVVDPDGWWTLPREQR